MYFIPFLSCIAIAFISVKPTFAEQDSVCPPLSYISLPNGKILVTAPGKIRFTCDKGYVLAGPPQIRCWNGRWTSARKPVCYKREGSCDPPPEVPNADVFSDKMLLYGSTVLYMCRPGYVSFGEMTRTCLSSGSWSGITPACLEEVEPLEDVASRLENTFMTKIDAYSSNDEDQKKYIDKSRKRYLDDKSLLKGLELVILVDRSSSVDPFDLERGKKFIKYLFQRFNVNNKNNPNGTRAAVIAFGTTVDTIFSIDDTSINNYQTAGQVLDEKLQAGGGGTAMGPAMVEAYMLAAAFFRKDAKRALFLISDGEPNVGDDDLSTVAENLKTYGEYEIFAVGIGRGINYQFLSSVVSEPIADHVFLLENYESLDGILQIIKNEPKKVPPPAPEKCGHFNGNLDENMPWNVAIYVSLKIGEENSTQLNLCGGALICSQWVLTAASCFYYMSKDSIVLERKEVFIVVGENHLFQTDLNQKNYYADHVKLHPDFKPQRKMYNNLALIKLNEPVPVDFKPICFPRTDATVPLHLKSELNASLSAWGFSSPNKKQAELISPMTTRYKSQAKFVVLIGERECQVNAKKRIIKKSIFCATTGAESCVGNIGTPVVAPDPESGIHHILGILSEKANCARGFSQFVELIKFIPWINQETTNCHFKHWN